MSTTALLADLSPMLEELLSNILEEADVRVVCCSLNDGDLLTAAAEADAQLVIVVRRDPADLCAIDSSLSKAVDTSVVALAPDATWACLHMLRPEKAHLEDVSSDQILQALSARHPDQG